MITHLVDVPPDLVRDNDDAPAPGRLLIVAGCPGCRTGRRFAVPAGRWLIDHDHDHDDRQWTLHRTGDAPRPEVDEVAALAGAIAGAAW